MILHNPLVWLFAIVVIVIAGLSTKARASKRYNYRAIPIMSPTEVKFFRQLEEALPALWIFPQVGFSALLQPKATGKEYWQAWGHMAQKRVDFALYDREMKLLAVVELDDPSHDRRRESDRERDVMLEGVGIRVVRFDVRRWPKSDQIVDAMFPPGTADYKSRKASFG